jgi:hypothetical protein
LLAVASAKREHEPFQVLVQLGNPLSEAAHEFLQRRSEAAGIAGQPAGEELQRFG